MKHLAPSILSADFNLLGQEMKDTEKEGAKYLHFDVMDGMFVPNISFGVPVLKSVSKTTEQIMDVHLMVQEPIRYVKNFAQAGADFITVHYEACQDLNATLQAIKDEHVKIGLSINPETPAEVVYPYLEQVDMVLVMGVHPGFGGQKLIPETFDKLRDIHKMAQQMGHEVLLEVDGGIKVSNLKETLDTGVDIVVMGSAVFEGDTCKNTKEIMEIMNSYE